MCYYTVFQNKSLIYLLRKCQMNTIKKVFCIAHDVLYDIILLINLSYNVFCLKYYHVQFSRLFIMLNCSKIRLYDCKISLYVYCYNSSNKILLLNFLFSRQSRSLIKINFETKEGIRL